MIKIYTLSTSVFWRRAVAILLRPTVVPAAPLRPPPSALGPGVFRATTTNYKDVINRRHKPRRKL